MKSENISFSFFLSFEVTFPKAMFTPEPSTLPSSKLVMLLFSNSIDDFSYSMLMSDFVSCFILSWPSRRFLIVNFLKGSAYKRLNLPVLGRAFILKWTSLFRRTPPSLALATLVLSLGPG